MQDESREIYLLEMQKFMTSLEKEIADLSQDLRSVVAPKKGK